MKSLILGGSPLLLPLLIVLVLLPMLATDIYLPAISSMGVELSASHSDLMLTLASYMVGYSLSLLLAGIFADIYGRRVVVLWGILIFCLASLASCFASSVEYLTLLRFCQALGGGCTTLLARVIVRDLFDFNSQVRVLSYLATALVLSPILGPILGAYLTVEYGWRSIFYVLTAFSSLTLCLVFFLLNESLDREFIKPSFSIFDLMKRYFGLLKHYEFTFHTLVISFAWSVYFSFISSSPGLLQVLYELSPLEYGFLFSSTISGYIFGTVFIRRKINKTEIKDLILFAALSIFVSTISLLIFSAMRYDSLYLLLPCVFLALFGVGIIFPATQAGVTRSFTTNIGLISGLFYSVEMMFGAICSFILSRLSEPSWTSTAFLMLCCAFIILALSTFDKYLRSGFANHWIKKGLK